MQANGLLLKINGYRIILVGFWKYCKFKYHECFINNHVPDYIKHSTCIMYAKLHCLIFTLQLFFGD